MAKHLPVDSPAYDASEEDNDPLTDDAASSASSRVAAQHVQHRTRHPAPPRIAAVLSSDSGVDSPTYDGDIESSSTAVARSSIGVPSNQRPPPVLVLSTPSEAGSPTKAHDASLAVSVAPPPPVPTLDTSAVNTATLTPAEIQAFVFAAIDGTSPRPYKINPPPVGRPVRVYADGVYDLFHYGHALQLRQAKLSFPSVYLIVGVCSDELVHAHKARTAMTHAERCVIQSLHHCRYVDHVLPTAPWVIDPGFIAEHQIDYVAHDDAPYAAGSTEDVYAYVKGQGKFIPTRRTPYISTSDLLERIVTYYRRGAFDSKLVKIGHAELTAQGEYGEASAGVGQSMSAGARKEGHGTAAHEGAEANMTPPPAP
ncbi:hypothetical protein JB92DRAFT_2765932 [Gautieria morchelliformis]|nr:hypothetical protein JB92DRAFT_2765932 [Gautieria morchelliformis]